MGVVYPESQSAALGVILRRSPGVTAWSKWAWRATGVLPGAGPACWTRLRDAEGVTDYHAATRDLWLYVSDTEAYAHELQARVPSVYVILRQGGEGATSERPLSVLTVTASPYEAQDYSDSGEEIVERVPMPPVIRAWVTAFVGQHHREDPFVKRRRDKLRTDRTEDGIGDARISQVSDVYRAPTAQMRGGVGLMAHPTFWARRRAAVRAEAEAEGLAAERAAVDAERDACAAERSGADDADILMEMGLPDPETMQAGDDFAAFMTREVPRHLQNRALRTLWRSNPVLACVDGLNDYDDDYSTAALSSEPIRTAYQVGKGMMAHLEEMARQAEAFEEAQPPGAEQEDDAAPAVAAADVSDAQAPAPDLQEVAMSVGDDVMADPAPRRMRFYFEGSPT